MVFLLLIIFSGIQNFFFLNVKHFLMGYVAFPCLVFDSLSNTYISLNKTSAYFELSREFCLFSSEI